MLGQTNLRTSASSVAANGAAESNGEVYDDGRLHIEYQGFYVECGGQPFYDLARKELLLLTCLARHAGRVVSYETLWTAAWPKVKEPVKPRTLRVHIGTLRQKLAPFGIEIVSVVHLGYRLLTAQPAPQTDLSGSSAVSESSLKHT
jgi:DNA-binding response OmpR family regulator